MSYFLRLLITKLGASAIAVVALSLYSLRLLGLSLLSPETAELALGLEVAKPVCTSLLLVRAPTFPQTK